jgi:dTDP-glucose 4,6-dehydratase
MNIAIVTGCAGFIGINFISRLLKEGWFVYGIDKLTYVSNTNKLNSIIHKYSNTFKFIHKDINDITWLPEADVLFNFAAESDVDNSNADCSSFIRSNISGVQNLLNLVSNRIIIRADKPLFVQISTDEVYGDIEQGSFSEDSRLNPSNPYAATKAAADMLIQTWNRTHGLDYIIVRPSNNYGKYQYPEKLIPLAVKRLSRNKKIKLHNNGEPIRTWTHVEDTIEAILTIYNKASVNKIYNISSEFEQKNKKTVEYIINSYFNYELLLEDYVDFTYNRPGQDIRYSISCAPLKNLGWEPKKVFKSELDILVHHYKETFNW